MKKQQASAAARIEFFFMFRFSFLIATKIGKSRRTSGFKKWAEFFKT